MSPPRDGRTKHAAGRSPTPPYKMWNIGEVKRSCPDRRMSGFAVIDRESPGTVAHMWHVARSRTSPTSNRHRPPFPLSRRPAPSGETCTCSPILSRPVLAVSCPGPLCWRAACGDQPQVERPVRRHRVEPRARRRRRRLDDRGRVHVPQGDRRQCGSGARRVPTPKRGVNLGLILAVGAVTLQCSGFVHPTWHCANQNLQVDGLSFAVSPAHSKLRRDGYRK